MIIIENNTDEPITWEHDEDQTGWYLRDTATGWKIFIKAQEVGECRMLRDGLASKYCDRCKAGARDSLAVVCMWKSAWGDPYKADSWQHLCAEHARKAGLPV